MDEESIVAQGLCGVMAQALISQGVPASIAETLASRACEPVAERGIRRAKRGVETAAKKGVRKVGNYQKTLGRELKKLKAKHPRTPVSKLMKRAHAATKKLMK